MKEQLYTIPLMDAFREKDECPFCFIHSSLEQHAIDFTLGSGASYMEDDIRFQTDKAGFCKDHYQKMFLYGNRLGSALILETHLKKLTKDLKEQTLQADILVSAVGKTGFVTSDMVKEGAVVIDVAMNRNAEGKLCGDVDFPAVSEKASAITPVPGGVGPMTRVMLLENTLTACKKLSGLA